LIDHMRDGGDGNASAVCYIFNICHKTTSYKKTFAQMIAQTFLYYMANLFRFQENLRLFFHGVNRFESPNPSEQ